MIGGEYDGSNNIGSIFRTNDYGHGTVFSRWGDCLLLIYWGEVRLVKAIGTCGLLPDYRRC